MPRPNATAHDSRARRYAVRRVVRPSPARIHAPEPGAWLPLPDLSLLPALPPLSPALVDLDAPSALASDALASDAPPGSTLVRSAPGSTTTALVIAPAPAQLTAAVVAESLRAPAQARAAALRTSPVSEWTARPEPDAERDASPARSGLRNRLLLLGALTVVVLVALPFLPTVGAAARTVVVDGKPVRLGEGSRLAPALRAAGVWIGPADRVLPSPDAPVSSLKIASVRRAVPLYVDVDGEHRYVLSAAADAAELQSELGLGDRVVATSVVPAPAATTGAAVTVNATSAVPAAFTPGTTVVYRTRRSIYLFVDGQRPEYESTALTVQEFLAERGVTLGANDTVDPPLDTRFTTGNAVAVTRFGTDVRTVVEKVPTTTVQRNNPQLAKGETRVTQEGSDGLVEVRHQRQVRDGIVIGDSVLSRTIVRPMVPRLVDVGTKVATGPASSSGGSEQGSATWYASPFGSDSCASKTVAKGTIVTVTNLDTGASTTCRVADYGPVPDGRIIDLDDDVFAQLAPLSTGVFAVRVEY